jgi:hypothetical protein
MLKGTPEPKPSSVQLTSQRRGRGGGAGDTGRKQEFVHAFADALRDILRDERRRAA